ncbi:Zinc finger, RING/FYVE/PHD-type [Phytophthora cactorum]|nr:Zinc finger, RING/FYVE/PHD-type [Phytophthora cactorum]
MNAKRLRKKRSLPTGPLPPRVAWLDGISMNVTPLISRPRNSSRIDYLLTVTCQGRDAADSSSWGVIKNRITIDMVKFQSGYDNYYKGGKTENSIRKNLRAPRTHRPVIPFWIKTSAHSLREPFSTLTCGHNFHDECLIGKFNEALECPTCGRKGVMSRS